MREIERQRRAAGRSGVRAERLTSFVQLALADRDHSSPKVRVAFFHIRREIVERQSALRHVDEMRRVVRMMASLNGAGRKPPGITAQDFYYSDARERAIVLAHVPQRIDEEP